MKKNKVIKTILFTISAIIVLIIIFIKAIDFGFKQPCSPPDKPKGIPTGAIWNGGCDGGYWVELVEIREGKYRFRIYLDYKAEVLMDADFISENNCLLPFDNSILNMIKVVELDRITIKMDRNNTCLMRAIYPAYNGSSWEIIKEKEGIE